MIKSNITDMNTRQILLMLGNVFQSSEGDIIKYSPEYLSCMYGDYSFYETDNALLEGDWFYLETREG